jgi:LacI family transcriptional regulator, repressor for deo operon, udp, cdd, tsx, nupC, and nupG
MATIQDVAALAGVSTATVSRTLSAPDIVSENTRKRVQAAVAKLNYAPNAAAKILRTTRTRKILVMVPDISNPFYSAVIRGIEESAHAAGYSVLLGDTQYDKAREDQYADMFQRKEADGLIILANGLPEALRYSVRRSSSRLAIVNGHEYDPSGHVLSVYIDNAAASREVMTHLHGLGHRHVTILAGPDNHTLDGARLNGALDCAASFAEPMRLEVTTGGFRAESGLKRALDILSAPDRPTALYCFNDELAMGALAAMRRLGLRCPADVSLVGFDDTRYARMMDPALTTVRQPMKNLGKATVDLLLEVLEGSNPDVASIKLGHRLILRESTAAAPA